MKDCKRYSNLAFFLSLIFLLASCNKEIKSEQYTVTGNALGTTYQIIYFSSEEFNVAKGLDSIFYIINGSMSTYQSNSLISKINEGDSSIVVDHHFKKVMEASKLIYDQSEGYFDPTVGDLVNVYGFGSEESTISPDSTAIDSLLQYVGFNKIQLAENNTLIKQDPNIYLEFNAIAKGYAIDVIGEYLDSKNTENYLIELGGELLSKGKFISKDKDWVVAVDNPMQTEGKRDFQVTINLNDRAMATSGNYRKFRIDSITGEKYVHTINPKTGYPEKSNLLSVTVLAESCMLADGYATAFMALGLEKSKNLVQTLEAVDVYFVYSENNEVKIFSTKGFEEVILQN